MACKCRSNPSNPQQATSDSTKHREIWLRERPQKNLGNAFHTYYPKRWAYSPFSHPWLRRPLEQYPPSGGVFFVRDQPSGVDRFEGLHRAARRLDHLRPARAVEQRLTGGVELHRPRQVDLRPAARKAHAKRPVENRHALRVFGRPGNHAYFSQELDVDGRDAAPFA